MARLDHQMTLLAASSQKCSIYMCNNSRVLNSNMHCAIVESCCQTFGVDRTSHVEGWPVSSVFLGRAFVKLLVVCRHVLHPKAHTAVSKLWDTCHSFLTIWGRRRPFSGKWLSQYLSCLWLSGVSVTRPSLDPGSRRRNLLLRCLQCGAMVFSWRYRDVTWFYDGLKRTNTTDISSNTRFWTRSWRFWYFLGSVFSNYIFLPGIGMLCIVQHDMRQYLQPCAHLDGRLADSWCKDVEMGENFLRRIGRGSWTSAFSGLFWCIQ